MNNEKIASEDILPIVYDRLRSFAKARFTQNDSLYGTELVHVAYLRVAGAGNWESEAHFFGAVRNAMKNAIADHLRKKASEKHGGKLRRTKFDEFDIEGKSALPEIIALSEAIDELEQHDDRAARIVTLRFFACMSEDEVAEELGISRRTVSRDWTYAKAWLKAQLQ
ncbi:MAG: ECF-type sigma factor [Planctomycetota bacterium]